MAISAPGNLRWKRRFRKQIADAGLQDAAVVFASSAFAFFDADQSGLLNVAKMRFVCDYLGIAPGTNDICELLANEFEDNEHVNVSTFCQWISRLGGAWEAFAVRRRSLQSKLQCDVPLEVPLLCSLQRAASEAGLTKDYCVACHLLGFVEELVALSELEPSQRAAIRYVREKARENHFRALPELLRRVTYLGFGDHMLWWTLAWIRERVPVVIHINIDKLLDFFLADTHYRNVFETHTHGARPGSSGAHEAEERKTWESHLFGGHYDNVQPFLRPKYGVLNIMNDPQGVAQCHAHYGDSYIILQNMRLRVTLSPQDSANLNANRLAVPEYYGHVLSEYSNEELRAIIRVANVRGADVCGNSDRLQRSKYKEAQLHGEVRLAEHAERLVANSRHRQDEQRIHKLCLLHGWALSWMDDEKARLEEAAIRRRTGPSSQEEATVKRWRSRQPD